MDDYLKLFREMISLRGLTDHTIMSYSTYIKTYLFYLSEILHKSPEDVSWPDLREFVRWLQKEKGLSDRTINHCISQLRFFTLYVLHKPWDPTQLPQGLRSASVGAKRVPLAHSTSKYSKNQLLSCFC